jgi:hypothetical protein
MLFADLQNSVEAAQHRLRRVRAEAARALGEPAVAHLGEKLLSSGAAPRMAVLPLALAVLFASLVAALAGPWTAAAVLLASALAALAGGAWRARRAVRVRHAIDLEIDAILGRLEAYVATQAARAREEAGTLDRAALQHSILEGTLLARLAPVAVRCPACGLLGPGSQFGRHRACPRCGSRAALAHPDDAAEGTGAQALADYAMWVLESQALAKAIRNARSVAEVARRAEREVKAGRAGARA